MQITASIYGLLFVFMDEAKHHLQHPDEPKNHFGSTKLLKKNCIYDFDNLCQTACRRSRIGHPHMSGVGVEKAALPEQSRNVHLKNASLLLSSFARSSFLSIWENVQFMAFS